MTSTPATMPFCCRSILFLYHLPIYSHLKTTPHAKKALETTLSLKDLLEKNWTKNRQAETSPFDK